MARARYNNMALTRTGVVVNTVPNAQVTLYEAGTTTPLADTIYANPTGVVTLTNPFFADSNGNYTFYLDTPQSIKISMTGSGLGTFVSDFEQLHPAPEDIPTTRAEFTITTADASATRLRIRDAVTFMPGPVQIGTDLGQTSDPAHAMYIHKAVTGSGVGNIVDTFLVEVNGATTDDSDIGAVGGFARAMTATGVVSMRALAGQMIVDLGSQAADREAVELGVHTAKAVTSKADNRLAFTKMFGNVGALISAYSGTQADGNPSQRANTAIAVNTFGGSGGHWKQFEVFWDVNNVKAWQVSDQGNVVAGGGGNNDDLPAYGFLDTNGDIDVGTGIFWGGNDVVGITTNTVERVRVDANGNAGFGGTAPAGSRIYANGGLIEAANGIKNSGVRIGALSIPTALAVNTDNYVPSTGTGYGTYQISASGAVELRGLALSQTVAGHEVDLINGGGNTITIVHNSGTSPSNPFNTHTGANHALTPGKSVTVIWTGAAWRFKAVT